MPRPLAALPAPVRAAESLAGTLPVVACPILGGLREFIRFDCALQVVLHFMGQPRIAQPPAPNSVTLLYGAA